uniref:Saposin B-type domain-containing protein n=1 Tax=Panagrolaimus sp. JU765 TaxID=591449 RepID=A0AC34RIM2_9BILA
MKFPDNRVATINYTNSASAPVLTLSCTLCQNLLNLTVSLYESHSMEEIQDQINSTHCTKLGLFKSICYLTLNRYYSDLYDSLSDAIEKVKMGKQETVDVRSICREVKLCSSDVVPAFCKSYYIEEYQNSIIIQSNPLAPKKEL